MRESVIYQEIKLEGREEGLVEGIGKGIGKGIEQVARNLLTSGMTVEQVVGYTGLSVQRVQQLQQQVEQ